MPDGSRIRLAPLLLEARFAVLGRTGDIAIEAEQILQMRQRLNRIFAQQYDSTLAPLDGSVTA